jgi:hypothetical protein
MGVVGMGMVAWEVGQEVVCPKCGVKGKVGIDTFTAKGRRYQYWTIRHYVGGKVRRCVVGRVGGSAPAVGTETEVPESPAEPKTEVAVVQAPAAGTVVEVPEPPVFKDETPIPEEVDRVAWYITKISASWGSFRENPSPENLNRFVKTVNQTAQRLGIPAGDLVAAAEYFYKVRSEKAKSVVNETVKRFVARIVIANTAHFASVPAEKGTETETMEIKEVKVEVPKEVAESIQAMRDQIAAIQKEVEYIKEQVRQRKGVGARAIARGEKRIEFKEGNMYWMIREVMRAGGEWTKEQIVDEIRRRFGKTVSGNSVSGRISEMAAAGYIQGRRVGRTWYWRWVGEVR